MIKKLLHEITLRFGLPRSLQGDNGTSFTSKATQWVSKTLGITFYLHCAWRPQSSGNVERDNQFLKSAIKKDNAGNLPGMKGGFINSSPPHPYYPYKEQFGLSLYEMLYGRPFVYVNDLFLGPEAQTLQSYTMANGQFQQDICLWGVNQDPKILKSCLYKLQGLKSKLKSGKMGPQRLNSIPHGRAPAL